VYKMFSWLTATHRLQLLLYLYGIYTSLSYTTTRTGNRSTENGDVRKRIL
jgi:hypothetical protein